MKRKIRVGILFGGRSAEHEVSIVSARNVLEAIDKNKYDVVLIGIDKRGKWHLGNTDYLLASRNVKHADLPKDKEEISLLPYETTSQLINTSTKVPLPSIDVIFPLLHGPNGEDGTIQGLLKLANIPYVGAGVLGSAVGMDKDVMKRLLQQADIPIAKFLVFYKNNPPRFPKIKKLLGLPFFIKPANLGSSVGVTKVHTDHEFTNAVNEAFSFDNKILVEQYLDGREIECSVLGNDEPIASLPGEIISRHEFYDYHAKYIDPDGAKLQIPARLPKKTTTDIQSIAIKVFQTLCCEGMARIDFFVNRKNNIFVNEINTLPGFTKISMFPKLWEASGIPYSELIDRLIYLAIERHEKNKSLKTTR